MWSRTVTTSAEVGGAAGYHGAKTTTRTTARPAQATASTNATSRRAGVLRMRVLPPAGKRGVTKVKTHPRRPRLHPEPADLQPIRLPSLHGTRVSPGHR